KPADKPAAKADTKAADKPGGGLLGRLPFGQKPADKADDKAAAAKPGDIRKTGTTSAVSTVAAPPKTAAPVVEPKKGGVKVPPARGEKVAKPLERASKQVTVQQGLSLDQKLDIVGLSLIIGGIMIFFSVFQPSE